MELTIEAKTRELFGKANRKLRRQGSLPAVLYGKGKDSKSLEVDAQAFAKVYKQAGENTLVDLVVAGAKPTKVLIQDVAKHYMKDEPTHIDFYEVDVTKKTHVKVPLHFVGLSPAVKEHGGVLLRSLDEVEVEALPQDLPKFIEISLDSLAELNDTIRIGDIKISDRVTILSNPEETVTIVKPPRTQEEIEALDEADTDTGAAPEEGEEGAEAVEGEEGEETKDGEEAEETEKKEGDDAGDKGSDDKGSEKKAE